MSTIRVQSGNRPTYGQLLNSLHAEAQASDGAPPASSAGDVWAGGGSYVVQPGDSLSKIAARMLGSASRWPEIYNLNRDRISNPNVIQVGQTLQLPGSGSAAPAPAPPPAPPAPYDPTPGPRTSMPSLLLRFMTVVGRWWTSQQAEVTPAKLAELGGTDKAAFFETLRPGAEEAERVYGVPAAVTLAQAALESGWGKHGIGGYNIFGIKGKGPSGESVRVPTQEWSGGRYITIQDDFAKYNSFSEAMVAHGALFRKSYYTKAMNQYKQDHDPRAFAHNLTGVYATDPQYGTKLVQIMNANHLA